MMPSNITLAQLVTNLKSIQIQEFGMLLGGVKVFTVTGAGTGVTTWTRRQIYTSR